MRLFVLLLLLGGCQFPAIDSLEIEAIDEIEDSNERGVGVRIEYVIDGDTVVTDKGTVRLIGIDTPEKGECGFGDARDYLRRLIDGREVLLIRDTQQDDRDKYGRLLRYIEKGSTDIGFMMIESGYAQRFHWLPADRSNIYRRAESESKFARNGSWSECDW